MVMSPLIATFGGVVSLFGIIVKVIFSVPSNITSFRASMVTHDRLSLDDKKIILLTMIKSFPVMNFEK